MENASKALLMAAGMLIALVIISALLLMFNNLSNYQQAGTQNTRESQVVDFNNQFETYNRKNVRGSDLYSLLNRVTDYNRRKSTEGLNLKDEGQYLAYKPVEIKFKIQPVTILAKDGTNRLVTKAEYTINQTKNLFHEDIFITVQNLETTYGKQVIQNLCTGMDKIFITSNNMEDKRDAIINFNNASGKNHPWGTDSQINSSFHTIMAQPKVDVYTYYEYVQFKRARFDCIDTKYDSQTGRIIRMEFEFNGKFE